MTKPGVTLGHLILNGLETELLLAADTCQHSVCVHTSHAPTAPLLPRVNTRPQVVKSKLWNEEQANTILYNRSLNKPLNCSYLAEF